MRTLSVSRATVRKVIRGEETTEFRYTTRAAQPSPKLGPWIKDLVEILEAEAKLPRRERRSTQRLFETLRGRGYEGAHDSVHRYAKAWRSDVRDEALTSRAARDRCLAGREYSGRDEGFRLELALRRLPPSPVSQETLSIPGKNVLLLTYVRARVGRVRRQDGLGEKLVYNAH